jgi:hypothetical protein
MKSFPKICSCSLCGTSLLVIWAATRTAKNLFRVGKSSGVLILAASYETVFNIRMQVFGDSFVVVFHPF